MKHRAIPLIALALALAIAVGSTPMVFAPAPCGGGTPSYTMTISPSTTISLGTSVTMTVSESGGARNSAYTLSFEVVKPNGTGSAVASKALATDSSCNGTVILSYPDPSFTASSGTVAADVGGVYSVYVNQTAPTNTGTVATGQFTVSSRLTVVISQPAGGSVVQRGQTITVSGTVSAASGPDGTATVSADTPSGGVVYLLQTSLGVYSINYQVTDSDPIGSWAIVLLATDSLGNSGTSFPVAVTVAKSDLIVDSLDTYNQKGLPTTSFSPGDTVYAFFRVRYSSGTYLTSGQYAVSLRDPSGKQVANLTAAYDSSRFGFFTSTGYPLSGVNSGTWTVGIGANSIDDGYGNTGPGLDTSVPLQVVVVTSPLSYWPFIVAAAVAILGGVIGVKRFDTSLVDFQHLEQLMGGPLPRGSAILLLGDPGSGKTILAYQWLYDELESGRLCALLSYDAFPEDVQGRMSEFGWDIISSLRKGRLKIVDCYSGLAGAGEGAIKDPSDLTELNIQVTAFIAKAKGGPVTLILDSLTPIFNGVDAKQAINFIQTLGAKVKKTGGLFVMTASRGAIPDDSTAKIKTMADGVIELNILRSRGKSHRFLTVLKMERRRISSNSAPFEIDRSKGMVFRVSRFKLLRNRLSSPLSWHLRARIIAFFHTKIEQAPTKRR
jgi:KaiC/GvpD/RAD55 family RecA-like ATPase